MTDLLSIGELSSRTGVATSALRYYDEIGLLRPVKRVSDRRRYNESAVDIIGVVLFLRDLGFTLAEVKKMMSSKRGWTGMAKRKLNELQRTIDDAQSARRAIEHALACPKERMTDCPKFWALIRGRLRGQSLAEAHDQVDLGVIGEER